MGGERVETQERPRFGSMYEELAALLLCAYREGQVDGRAEGWHEHAPEQFSEDWRPGRYPELDPRELHVFWEEADDETKHRIIERLHRAMSNIG
jgi:hypothetical protein